MEDEYLTEEQLKTLKGILEEQLEALLPRLIEAVDGWLAGAPAP